MEEKILKNLGITALNDMQTATLDANTTGQDLILLSPTGSGKTLAFLLSILQHLDPDKNGVQAIVFSPSRELALQIESVFRKMGTGFKVNSCYGGHSFKTETNNFSEPPAVLVGTPGRIRDHIGRKSFRTGSVHTLVFDEFDKSLEFGFEEDMKSIVVKLFSLERKILTSATKSIKIPGFTKMKNPIELNFTHEEVPHGLTLKAVKSDGTDKLEALLKLVCMLSGGTTIVFCNHRAAVDRISEILKEKGLVHDVFHGGLEQEERERALIKFRNGSHRTLICTDLASRGLDIPEIKNVVHYQLPPKEDAYIHRNGRTARMTAEGDSYLVLAEEEEVPAYIQKDLQYEDLPEEIELPIQPEWETLFISGGKKDKINKIDIVGLMLKQGELDKDELGLIEVMDNIAFAAVKLDKVQEVIPKVSGKKVKKRKVKVSVAR